ncbi:MAG: exosome 3'-_5 exonuclease subunit ski4 (Csl4) [Trizodia sp. TS-e1964]|nr:MAG: exosome 3'->5 exonuclease subunit ski4 (Csl4) [Trizodia sp. TS-e1964]
MTAPIAIPGQHLGSLADYSPGAGTHQAAQQIVASILGAISIAPGAPPTISVSSTSTSTSTPRGPPTGTVLPAVDAEVLARVVRIAPRQATVAILVVAGHVCSDEFQGVIRVEDVRATEKDKVRIQASFRPGDIVRAKVG